MCLRSLRLVLFVVLFVVFFVVFFVVLFASAVIKASFFRVKEHLMLPFHYSRIITSHSEVPMSTRARGWE